MRLRRWSPIWLCVFLVGCAKTSPDVPQAGDIAQPYSGCLCQHRTLALLDLSVRSRDSRIVVVGVDAVHALTSESLPFSLTVGTTISVQLNERVGSGDVLGHSGQAATIQETAVSAYHLDAGGVGSRLMAILRDDREPTNYALFGIPLSSDGSPQCESRPAVRISREELIVATVGGFEACVRKVEETGGRSTLFPPLDASQ